MHRLIILIFFILISNCASAQQVFSYHATIRTSAGTEKGILYKVNDRFVCLSSDNDYLAIPISSIRKIKLKASKDAMGLKTMQGIAQGSKAGKESFNDSFKDYQAGYRYQKPDLADASGAIITHAVVGGISGIFTGLGKAKTFRFDRDKAGNGLLINDLKDYAVYNQRVR